MPEFDLQPSSLVPAQPVTRRSFKWVWPVVGTAALALSLWFLVRDLRGLSLAEVQSSLAAIPAGRWGAAVLSTLLAYAALAWYDRIALSYLGFDLSWGFISAVSFTTYALSHNIGMSMFSGAMVRYRAYSTRGLSATDVGALVAFCSFTFGLGTALLGGLVFLLKPEVAADLFDLPETGARLAGSVLLAGVLLYALGSALNLKSVRIGTYRLVYPRPTIALKQLVAGPLELIGAAGIIYCALPDAGNPGFMVVLGVFLGSFSAALLSHAPGGLGVLELVFVTALPEVPKPDVLAALLVFRLLYFLVPLGFGIVAVVLFEKGRLARTIGVEGAGRG